ncbi:MAG TPA: helix-hairpin-helix domain-containing protein [Candidatus Brocadiales bacterium]|nr:helix-hairpin-helix domain-containing protein [Candidatus Brocadiales bacterium]
MESPPKLFALASLSGKELIVIFSLCITLLLSIVSKYIVDYHWNTPNIEVIQPQSGQQIKFQLDINKAEWYELILLPEIGEARAKAIAAYRKKYGDFRDIKQLLNVKGMNGSVVDAIKDYVKVNND